MILNWQDKDLNINSNDPYLISSAKIGAPLPARFEIWWYPRPRDMAELTYIGKFEFDDISSTNQFRGAQGSETLLEEKEQLLFIYLKEISKKMREMQKVSDGICNVLRFLRKAKRNPRKI